MFEDKTKKYFLGELSASETDDFEESLAVSRDLTEQAQITEQEIIDDYLLNKFSPSERALFEKNYLTTDARQKKLEISRLFFDGISSQPANLTETKTRVPFWQTAFGFFSPVRSFAFASAAILIAVIIFIWLNNRKNSEELVVLQNSNSPAITEIENKTQLENTEINSAVNSNRSESPAQNNQPKIVSLPETNSKSTASPKSEPLQTTLATFTLLPGNLRSGGEQFVKISPGTNKVNFRLTLPESTPKYADYSIVLKTSGGETVLSTANNKTLNLTVPPAKLKSDVYIIFLSGNSPSKLSESVAEYTFRITR